MKSLALESCGRSNAFAEAGTVKGLRIGIFVLRFWFLVLSWACWVVEVVILGLVDV